MNLIEIIRDPVVACPETGGSRSYASARLHIYVFEVSPAAPVYQTWHICRAYLLKSTDN